MEFKRYDEDYKPLGPLSCEWKGCADNATVMVKGTLVSWKMCRMHADRMIIDYKWKEVMA